MDITDLNLTPEQLAAAAQNVTTCCLCNSPLGNCPLDCLGVFVPDNPERWGAPAGKRRLLFYGVCHRCSQRPGFKAEAQAVMASKLVGQ